VSRTRKDSRKHQGTLLEIVKVDDEAFDLLLNHEVYRTRAPLAALPEWLCVRYGFCGKEYEAILEEVNRAGRKIITL
jgi:hypothetical protein